MIKGVLIAIVTVLLSSAAYAQDFASQIGRASCRERVSWPV